MILSAGPVLRIGSVPFFDEAMMKKHILFLSAAAVLLPLALSQIPAPTAPAKAAAPVPERKPNILIIVADDLGYSDVGAFGGEARRGAGRRVGRLCHTGRRRPAIDACGLPVMRALLLALGALATLHADTPPVRPASAPTFAARCSGDRGEGSAVLPASRFLMGSDRFYPEKGSPTPVKVEAFRIDAHEMTTASLPLSYAPPAM